jgi:hypothetical protein
VGIAKGISLHELVERSGRCAIVDRNGSTVYRNDRKGGELFERRFPGISEIVRVVESSKEYEIAATVEAGIGTPAILDFLLKVKASLSTVGKRGSREHDAVTTALTAPLKMALAELDLERDAQIAQVEDTPATERPFFRIGPELRPSGFGDEAVRTDLLSRLSENAAEEIIRRKADYEKAYGSARLVYAASEPFLMAAIFIPPWLEEGVVGQTSAAYSAGPQYRRVSFGRVLDQAQGVTFLDLYYTVDLWAPSS